MRESRAAEEPGRRPEEFAPGDAVIAAAAVLCASLLKILGQWGFGAIYIVSWGVWYAIQGGLIAKVLSRN